MGYNGKSRISEVFMLAFSRFIVISLKNEKPIYFLHCHHHHDTISMINVYISNITANLSHFSDL